MVPTNAGAPSISRFDNQHLKFLATNPPPCGQVTCWPTTRDRGLEEWITALTLSIDKIAKILEVPV